MPTGPTNAPTPNLSTIIDGLLSALPALNGLKTYLAAAGLAGLALYQATTGDYMGAYASLMGALAAVGLRHAIAKSTQ